MLRYSGQTFDMTDSNGVSYKVIQVTKDKARKAYEDGKPVWMHPCLMRIVNHWQTPMPFSRKQIEDNAFFNGSTFDNIVSDYRYYNCDNERGKYPIFFVPAV